MGVRLSALQPPTGNRVERRIQNLQERKRTRRNGGEANMLEQKVITERGNIDTIRGWIRRTRGEEERLFDPRFDDLRRTCVIYHVFALERKKLLHIC